MLDLTQNFMRPQLSTVPGAAIPYAYGGKVRQIQIDLDPQALQSKGLSANDVSTALANQNQIIPAGLVKSARRNTPSSSTTRRKRSRISTTCRSRR